MSLETTDLHVRKTRSTPNTSSIRSSSQERSQKGTDILGMPGTHSTKDRNSDSMRVASCAQLLAVGQWLRDWCARRGPIPKDDRYEGEWIDYEWYQPCEWWIYKRKEPFGKQRLNVIVAALDTESIVTGNEWVKAILAVRIFSTSQRNRLLNRLTGHDGAHIYHFMGPQQR